MFSIRWGRFGPLFGVTKLHFGGVGSRRLVRAKACPVRMSTDLGGVPAIRRRRAHCTAADGNPDPVVRNRGRVPHPRGLRTTVPSCGGPAARSHRASFPTGRHDCPADVGRLGSAGSTTAGSGPPETPASSGSPAYSQGAGDRDRSGVPDPGQSHLKFTQAAGRIEPCPEGNPCPSQHV